MTSPLTLPGGCPNCSPGYLRFDCEAKRNDELLELQNMARMRRFRVGERVLGRCMDSGEFVVPCQVIGFVGGGKIEETGLIGPYYHEVIEFDGSEIVTAESELVPLEGG
jgi:hypothetical protein